MPTNPYFTKYNNPGEQQLYQDLTMESIRVFGVDLYYLPRTAGIDQDIFGEDPLSSYMDAVNMEMYVKNVEGWEGEGDIMSKFGIQIPDRITFTIAQKRWNQARTEKIVAENAEIIINEDADILDPDDQLQGLVLESGTTTDTYSLATRPLEGDAIYFPMVDKMFIVRFVEHEQLFYQLGKLMTYDIVCEKFDYSSEAINTNVAVIDAIEDEFTHNILDDKVLSETGFVILLEDGGYMINDGEARIEDQDVFANNELIQIEVIENNYIDYSEMHPFTFGVDKF